MLTEIDGKKIKDKRGERSLAEIVRASGNAFSDVALMKWENNKMKPKKDKIPPLLKALGCEIDDITVPVELAVAR